MVISHKHKFIFLHSRKTAGSSITAAINPHLGQWDMQLGSWPEAISSGGRYNLFALQYAFSRPQSLLFKSLRKSMSVGRLHIDPEAVNQIVKSRFKDRYQLSLAAHAKAREVKERLPRVWRDYYKFAVVRNPWNMMVSDYYWRLYTQGNPEVSFDEFVRRVEDPARPDPEHLRPPLISNWEILSIDEQICVNFVARFENLEEDLKSVEKEIGIPINLSTIRAKGTHRQSKPDIASHYNNELINRVGRIFEKEISAFNYQPTF